TRSQIPRFGARRCDQFNISSWCFNSTDSAMTDRTPPGRRTRQMVTTACRKTTMRSRMLTDDELCCFFGLISNSPGTGPAPQRGRSAAYSHSVKIPAARPMVLNPMIWFVVNSGLPSAFIPSAHHIRGHDVIVPSPHPFKIFYALAGETDGDSTG